MRTEVGRGTEGPGSSPRSRALGGAFVGTVLLLIGVVALASRAPVGGSASGPAASARDGTVSPWALVVMAVGAGVALAGVVAYVRLQVLRRGEPVPFPSRVAMRAPLVLRVALVVVALLIGGALVAGANLGFHRRAGSAFGSSGRVVSSSGPGWSFQLPPWVLPIVLGAVAAGVVVLFVGLRARRRPASSVDADQEKVDGDLEKVDAVRVAVEASLRDLRDGQDPRCAVIAAYRRMEQTLAAAGLPRRPAETPREYVVHALTSLELRAEPPRTLTTLFERARFSVWPIDAAMRDQAIDALVAMQHELEGIG
jgi:Domain of unknown function (DUF4129)